MNFLIESVHPHDAYSILLLYQEVARTPGGIIRIPEEVNHSYVKAFVQESIKKGISLKIHSVDDRNLIIGEIHAYTAPLFAFSHILADLTIVVHPKFQGKGIGRLLFETFIQKVKSDFKHILRVELFVRENNKKAIAFYQSLGFTEEGRFKDKIRNLDGTFETPIGMCWVNPAFKKDR